MKLIARLLGCFTAGMAGLFFVRITSPRASILTAPKLLAAALSRYLIVASSGAVVLGLVVRSRLAVLTGVVGALAATRYVHRVTAPHDGFARAFGRNWERDLSPDLAQRMLPTRGGWRLPSVPDPRWERDVPFWTIPGTDRRLLCDLWRPPAVAPPPAWRSSTYMAAAGITSTRTSAHVPGSATSPRRGMS